jgi:hypothetical protein
MKHCSIRNLRRVLLAAVFLAAPLPAFAQIPGRDPAPPPTQKKPAQQTPAQAPIQIPAPAERSDAKVLEFRADLPYSRLSLEGESKIKGLTPLRIPGPLNGDYWLTAQGRGVEKQRGRVSVRLDEEGPRIVAQGPVTASTNIRRALLFPGLAQFGFREHGRGLLMAGSAIGSIVMVGVTQDDLWKEAEEKDAIENQLQFATDPQDQERLQANLREAEEEESLARSRRNLYLLSTIGVWAISMADAAFFSPKFEVSAANENTLAIAMHEKSRGAAIGRSLLFPGLGQQYNGQDEKAFAIASVGIFGVAVLLAQQEDVMQEQSELDQTTVRASNLPPGPERDALLEKAKLQAAERDIQADHRLWALIGLGTYWGLSLLDTALSFDEPWGAAPVGEGWKFGLSPIGEGAGVVAMRRF